MSLKSNFTILENTDRYILIHDDAEEYQSMSVTNDAENVVEYLYENGLLKNDKRIFYVDTLGSVDELEHTLGVFNGFKFGFESLEIFNVNKNSI